MRAQQVKGIFLNRQTTRTKCSWLAREVYYQLFGLCRVEYEVFLQIESILIIEFSYVNPQLAFN